MRARTLHFYVAVVACAIGSSVAPHASVAEPNRVHLQIRWPPNWEYRAPVRNGPVVHLQARENANGRSRQRLTITVIDTEAAQKPITKESIRDLAARLRDATLATAREKQIALAPFANADGFYFVATDRRYDPGRSDDYAQLAEGVLLRSGYLITFTLLSHDASSLATRQMITALEMLVIQ